MLIVQLSYSACLEYNNAAINHENLMTEEISKIATISAYIDYVHAILFVHPFNILLLI